MPVSLVGVSPLFIVNNAIFLVTGWFMILGNQQLGYYQANSPYSFLAGIAQYAGMSILGMLWMVADWMRGGPRPLQNGLRLRLLLPVALPDLCDTFFTIFGILNLGSGMFIIIFSFVTVLAALIRWIFLKKKLYWWQWLAIAAITVTIIATGAGGHGGGEGGGPEETEAEAEAAAAASLQRSIGFLCTIIATTMDAIMYVCAEHALSTNPNAETEAVVARPSRDAAHTEQLGRVADPEARALLESAFELIDELKEELSSLSTKGVGQRSHAAGPVTPAEMTTVVGLVNLPLVSLYVGAYSLSGK
jgi:drug/metabolite transporter (DMT)-like permease